MLLSCVRVVPLPGTNRCQRRIVSGVNREPTASSPLRPIIFPLTAKYRRCSSVNRIRFLPMCSFSTATYLGRYSIRDSCSQFTQLARTISINSHGRKTNFIGVSAARQIQDNHWRGPKCKAAWPILCVIEACRHSAENDRGNIVDAIARFSSIKIDRSQSVKTILSRWLWLG